MATYSKLLLSSGGGIVSIAQKAEQAKNTASIIIGLGGTGVHAIRTIKTQVLERIAPDNADAIVPEYSHIRFIGVDADKKSSGIVPIDSTKKDELPSESVLSLAALDNEGEFLDIGNKKLSHLIGDPKARVLNRELGWLNPHIDHADLTAAGAGGVRQVGRCLLMNKADSFKTKVVNAIRGAMTDLDNPDVFIHVFAGISGGTGSGCFLDACYIIRQILAESGWAATVFGYFFLPDVNLSVVEKGYIPVNGYAAMKELDYCMQLPANGGSFKQYCLGFHEPVKWDCPPVDMCHLVCATDANGKVISNAYDYAMNVTAEYVMDFLTHTNDAEFTLTSHLANYRRDVATKDAQKDIGSYLGYCTIGAASTYVPIREINTYLASELFTKMMPIKDKIPVELETKRLLAKALTGSGDRSTELDMYQALWVEMKRGAEDSYREFTGDWRTLHPGRNEPMGRHYLDTENGKKCGAVTTNANSMRDAGNQSSLVGRIKSELYSLMCDINRGPIYAYRMLEAARSHNLLNILDGIIAVNNTRWSTERAQTSLRLEELEKAENEVKRRLNRRNAEEYEFRFMRCAQNEFWLFCYEEMSKVLNELKKQLESLRDGYFLKFSHIMSNLLETFEVNRNWIASLNAITTRSSFSKPMMSLSDKDGKLKKSLDEQIAPFSIPNIMDGLVRLFMAKESEWLTEDENKISKLVNEFFVNNIFKNFAGKTILAFLQDRYDTTNAAEITEYVYRDHIMPLVASASPLFFRDENIWKASDVTPMSIISIPEGAGPIESATTKMQQANNDGKDGWRVKKSALTDRIFVMHSATVFPMGSYSNCRNYERAYWTGYNIGTHYYEGETADGSGPNFDWHDLPSPVPYTRLVDTEVNELLGKQLSEIGECYEKAIAAGLLTEEGIIYGVKEEKIDEYEQLISEAEKLLEKQLTPADNAACKAIIDKLTNFNLEPVITGENFVRTGNTATETIRQNIQRDRFYLEPVHRMFVDGMIKKIDVLQKKAAEKCNALSEKVGNIVDKTKDLSAFCDAVFTGVISADGIVISYSSGDIFDFEPKMLNKYDDAYPFNSIPFYQAFLSYRALEATTKKEISDRVGSLINSRSPQIAETCRKLNSMFDQVQIGGWLAAANNFAEKDEIVSFLREFVTLFKNQFCPSHGIILA